MSSITAAQLEQRRRASRARWGEPRIARLDSLEAPVRAVVLALIEADRAAKALRASSPAEEAA